MAPAARMKMGAKVWVKDVDVHNPDVFVMATLKGVKGRMCEVETEKGDAFDTDARERGVEAAAVRAAAARVGQGSCRCDYHKAVYLYGVMLRSWLSLSLRDQREVGLVDDDTGAVVYLLIERDRAQAHFGEDDASRANDAALAVEHR